MDSVATNIRLWRTLRGMSQTTLAKRAGVASNMVGVYERGISSPTIHQLQRIAAPLNVSLIQLIVGPDYQFDEGDEAGVRLPQGTCCLLPYVEKWAGELQVKKPPYWSVEREVVPHDECLVTRLFDNGMYPFLIRGDAVLIDPLARKPRSGDIVLVNFGGGVRVRRYLIYKRRRSFESPNYYIKPVMVSPKHKILGSIMTLLQRRELVPHIK